MLRFVAAQAETLWDEALPIEVRELPEDLAALDKLLSGPGLLNPFVACWQREATVSGISSADHGCSGRFVGEGHRGRSMTMPAQQR